MSHANHVRIGNDAGQRHGYRQLSLVPDHRHQLHQPLEPVRESRLCEGFELGALLEDLGEDLHEGRPRLGVAVIAEPCRRWTVVGLMPIISDHCCSGDYVITRVLMIKFNIEYINE